MQHNGKLLVRPDSGDMVEISVKTIEKLWNTFEGSVNSKGYKVLDPHIGIIYGDGCTLNNVKKVWEELEKKGFAANNIVFGVGAFCFSAVVEPDGLCGKSDEDSFGFTYAVLDRYIRTGICDDPGIKRRIDRLHTKNKFKLEPMPYFNYKEDNNMTYCCSPEDIAVALEKAQETINHKHVLDKELRSCERQIKDALGVDVYIMPKDEHVYKTLSKDDISFVGRTKDIATGKIRTTVGFKDGTQTSVVLNDWEDEDDTEKAIMWCLLKKCFKSKRSLEKVIYSMEDM